MRTQNSIFGHFGSVLAKAVTFKIFTLCSKVVTLTYGVYFPSQFEMKILIKSSYLEIFDQTQSEIISSAFPIFLILLTAIFIKLGKQISYVNSYFLFVFFLFVLYLCLFFIIF